MSPLPGSWGWGWFVAGWSQSNSRKLFKLGIQAARMARYCGGPWAAYGVFFEFGRWEFNCGVGIGIGTRFREVIGWDANGSPA